MKLNKEELTARYQYLIKNLSEKVSEKFGTTIQAASSGDSFYKITDRNLKQNEEQEIMDEIIAVVEEYNNLSRGSIKAGLPSKVDYSKKLSTAIITLSHQGWFINYEMSPSQIYKSLDLLNAGEVNNLDIYMGNIVKKQLAGTEEIITIRHTDRKEPLEAAFRAHSFREYYLSIPVFLAQVDGISNELIKMHIFKKPNRVKNWATKTPQDEVHKIMCSALLGLDAGEFHMKFNRAAFTSGISRHAILHGDNNVYGSEVNSLKAISLLRYVSDVISPREVHGYAK